MFHFIFGRLLCGHSGVVIEVDEEVVDVVHHDLELVRGHGLEHRLVIRAGLVLDHPLQHLVLVSQIPGVHDGYLSTEEHQTGQAGQGKIICQLLVVNTEKSGVWSST